MSHDNSSVLAAEAILSDNKPPESQGRLIFKRFLRNKVAVGALPYAFNCLQSIFDIPIL